jgi:hypothetical protein
MKHIALTALCLALAACGGKTDAAKDTGGKAYTYKTQLTFTPRTLEKLKAMGEKVTVANMYYGNAKEGTAAAKSEGGQVQLGENLMEVDPADQIVTSTVAAFKADKLKDVAGEPMLLINVYTARKVAKDNLINCGIFDDTLEKAVPAKITIECDLIEPETPVTPGEPPPPQPDVP